MSDSLQHTIVAIATGATQAAIGLVRISGLHTLSVLSRHCRRPGKTATSPNFADRPRHSFFSQILNEDGELLDEGLVVYFAAGASYTGEDLAELALHGNPLLLRRTVQAILESAARAEEDVRPAGPGEFTKRAYWNGRMDLSRAEAVHRLVTARSEIELEASRKNLGGELSRLTSRFRSALIHLKAETEAEVDFSTEDLTFESLAERRARVEDILNQLEELLRRGKETERLRGGFEVALAGVPNAGKSSLLNLVLGWKRAIVSPVAGTTRDYVTEEIQLEGAPLRFVDTAGLRETEDVIEEQGVRLSLEAIRRADIVLHVVDGSLLPYDFPAHLRSETRGKLVHVFNKSDLRDSESEYRARGAILDNEYSIALSCTTGAGAEELRALLRRLLFDDPDRVHRDALLLEDRHRYHFERVRAALRKVLELWDAGAPDEITALELDRALDHAGQITGRIDTEEVLGRIFSVFCVGK